MNLIDTHTHLYLDEYVDDRQSVLQRALKAGVSRLLLPAVDSSSFDALQSMVLSNPALCFPMVGLHPTSVDADFERELAFVEKTLNDNRMSYIAVGEVGLDLYWDTSFLPQQIEALRRQIEMARERDLPVVLHLRSAKKDNNSAASRLSAFDAPDAYELFFKIWDDLQLEKSKNILLGEHQSREPKSQASSTVSPGVMHCFSGSVYQALQAIGLGFFIGVGGVVTYKNAELQRVVEAIPLESILLETDSPYLAPVPYRGKRNESAYIVEVVNKIAEIKGCPVDQVAVQTTLNAETLFRLSPINHA